VDSPAICPWASGFAAGFRTADFRPAFSILALPELGELSSGASFARVNQARLGANFQIWAGECSSQSHQLNFPFFVSCWFALVTYMLEWLTCKHWEGCRL